MVERAKCSNILNPCYLALTLLRLILIGELFSHNFQKKNLEIIGDTWYLVCINVRRRSVTIREILQKQKNQVRYISHIWKKKSGNLWKIKKLRERNVEKMGKKALR